MATQGSAATEIPQMTTNSSQPASRQNSVTSVQHVDDDSRQPRMDLSRLATQSSVSTEVRMQIFVPETSQSFIQNEIAKAESEGRLKISITPAASLKENSLEENSFVQMSLPEFQAEQKVISADTGREERQEDVPLQLNSRIDLSRLESQNSASTEIRMQIFVPEISQSLIQNEIAKAESEGRLKISITPAASLKENALDQTSFQDVQEEQKVMSPVAEREEPQEDQACKSAHSGLDKTTAESNHKTEPIVPVTHKSVDSDIPVESSSRTNSDSLSQQEESFGLQNSVDSTIESKGEEPEEEDNVSRDAVAKKESSSPLEAENKIPDVDTESKENLDVDTESKDDIAVNDDDGSVTASPSPQSSLATPKAKLNPVCEPFVPSPLTPRYEFCFIYRLFIQCIYHIHITYCYMCFVWSSCSAFLTVLRQHVSEEISGSLLLFHNTTMTCLQNVAQRNIFSRSISKDQARSSCMEIFC